MPVDLYEPESRLQSLDELGRIPVISEIILDSSVEYGKIQ